MSKINLFLISLFYILIPNVSIANEIVTNRAFINNCNSNINKKGKILEINLGSQNIGAEYIRAYYTITLLDPDGKTNEISVLESIGNDYGKGMFMLINNAYISNSYVEITRCESNRISGLKIKSK
ncbi:hypothetical protein [Morganella psychrotolerans]|uniref:Uncharacterized protein n=1 Tax=Morganella psychrotolerans TaxID=368603 RepID=A0A1B8HR38_9GAMM|nr:hypothetical protein [Morganella psychrotolerans]OBU12096.1 hypothetical protein AYY18_17245 [Morganella psychrotolerans]